MILTSCIFIECKEYADLVYETENSPTLRINAGSNKVSRCAIIETPLIIGGIPAKLAEFPHMVKRNIQKEIYKKSLIDRIDRKTVIIIINTRNECIDKEIIFDY